MSKLQELIQALCPDGVPHLPIKEIASCYAGATPKTTVKEYWDSGNIPWMSSGEVNKQIITETENFITQAGFDSCSTKMVPANSVVIALAGQGKTRGLVALTKIDLCTNQSLCAIVPNAQMNSSFLYHFLGSQYQKLRTVSSGDGTRGGLNLQMINSYVVPVPPIEVQDEIVRILDTFSAHAAELQAELQARKEQYEYYRNLLLTFNPSACGCGTDGEQKMDDVTTWGGHSYKITWKAMGEIGTFIRGKRFVRTDIVDNGVPCIHYGDMYTHYGLYADKTPGFINDDVAKKMRYANKNDVVIVAAGENKDDLGNALAWLGDEPAAVHDACFIFKSEMYPNFVSHVCRSLKYHKQVRMYANEAKICSVSGTDLAKVIIPVPEYELQVKIASILDRFETLVNDLTTGLPAEIAAVKEQYEYYRNKLLTFKQIA